MIPREATSNFSTAKKEINNNISTNNTKLQLSKPSSSSTTTTTSSWPRLKDPRIVRVSRAFGGKDRHSKVCTIRGLRDRRVRLSVPTAIQLYDLQDRLGLNQPSKVVDWLLNAAKHEIDELPPLQIPHGSSFMQNQLVDQPNNNQFIASDQSAKQGLRNESTTWARNDQEERQFIDQGDDDQYVSTNNHNFLSCKQQNPSSLTSLLNNASSYNSLLRWDSSNLLSLSSSSRPPMNLGLAANHHYQHEDLQNFNLVQLSSSSTLPHHHQVLVYQPGMSTQPFPSTNAEFHQKQPDFRSSEMSNSSLTSPVNESNNNSTQPVRPFHFSMTENLLPSRNN